MGIIDRFTTIMKSNINALLDKAEDPAKMVDQTLYELREDLAEVRTNTAKVMAEEKRVKKQLYDCDADIVKYESAAKNALVAGNEDDAKTLIAQNQSLVSKKAELEKTYAVAKQNADKMRQMHDKLVSDIQELESRKESIKAKVSVAKAQESVAHAMGNVNSQDSIAAFERMEGKADKMLRETEAKMELNESMQDSGADALTKKYAGSNSSVDDELEKMKKELGL